MNIQSYPTIFSDKFGEIETTMFNDFENLSICIDDIWFVGQEFSTLKVKDFAELSPEQIERFDLTKIQTLHDCTFRLSIPQLLVNTNDNTETLIDWQIVYELGTLQANGGLDKENLTLTLATQPPIIGQGGWFEEALNQILSQLKPDFKTQHSPYPVYFKNCYGCQWSDYSIYGNSSFGDLICFLGQTAYLNATSKHDLIPLMNPTDETIRFVQEIYCCEHFTPRPLGSGYRG